MSTNTDIQIYGEGGGGGCFPAGTPVNTPTGYKKIEELAIGDDVYAFDLTSFEPGEIALPGRIFVKKVTQTFTHTFGEVGYTSKLLTIVHERGELKVTGNHYILNKSRHTLKGETGFCRADELEIGDVLYTEFGEETVIKEVVPGDDYDFVYNLEVEELHTYVAGQIRVHNGGGGKSGGRTAVQAPNTVRTNQIARVLLCPGEGEGIGPWDNANPAKSVFFDGTPLQNADGSFNYTNITVDYRTGLPSQTVIPGFSGAEAETLVNQAVTTVAPITRTVTTANVDSVRVTIEFPNGLQAIDVKSGDANGTAVQVRISRRITGGTFAAVTSPTIKEMSSGPFTVSYLIPRPTAAGTWEFKVERLTADSSSNYLINATNLKSYTEIQDVQLPYNNRMLVALTVGADSTNGRIPNIAMDIGGHKVLLPNNYNPTTRVYTGSWGGTFNMTPQWTDNPAWLLYDLIVNDRYGLGSAIPDAMVDVFSFYQAGVYCDELIDNGLGTGTFEPRFTFNAQLMVREDAWKTLQAIASAFNSMLYMHSGMIRISQDRPATATKLISNSNVATGIFTYSSTQAAERYTACNITFSDPNDNFLPKTVTESSSTGVARYGYQTQDLVAYGATSEGQARRAAKWAIDTALNSTRYVEFSVDIEHADFEPGEVFKLMDLDYAQVWQEGRLLAVSGSTLTLDKALTKTTGTWTIDIVGADGSSIETRTITSAAGTSPTITISGTTTAAAGAVYIITGAVSPQFFRCVSLMENQKGLYNVKAVFYDPTKYPRIEQGINIPAPVYWAQSNLNTINAPSAIQINPVTVTNPEGYITRMFNVSWTPPLDRSAASYRIAWRKDNGPLTILTSTIPFVRIQAIVSGFYEFYVNAINAAGVTSPTLSGNYSLNIDAGTGSGVNAPTNLQLAGGASNFGTGSMNVIWIAPTPVAGYTLKDYEVTLQVPGGAIFKTFYTTNTSFSYSYDQNVADGGPRPSIQVNVRARDTFNKTGAAVTNTFNAAGAASVLSLQIRGGGTTFNTLDMEIEWTALDGAGGDYTNDPTFGYYKVEVLSGVTVKRSEQVYQPRWTYSFSNNVKDNGQDTPMNSIQVRVTAYNNFSVPGATGTTTFTPAAPPAPTNLTVQGKAAGTTVFDTLDAQFQWDCITGGTNYQASNVFKDFKVEILNGTTVKRTEYLYPDGKYEYTFANNILDNGQDNPSAAIIVRVTARNVYNITGTPLSVTFTPEPPPTCTLLYVVNTTNTTFITNDLEIEWDCLVSGGGNYVGSNMFKEFRVRAYNSTTLKRTDIAAIDKYSYDYYKNQADNGGAAIRTPILEVTARSVYNVYGTATAATFSNAAPSAPNVTTTPGVDMIFIDAVRQAADIDVEGYVYHISTTSGFTPSGTVAGTGTCVYAGPNSNFVYKVTGGTTYYVKVAAYDGFGMGGLQYSTQTAGAVSVPITGYDYQFPGFVFTPNSPSSNKVAWNAGTVQQVAGVGAPQSFSVGANNATWTSGSLYIYWDQAAPTVFQSTTSIGTATGLQKRIVAVYKGGTDVSTADGKTIIDGTTTILPGTITAPLLFAGGAVITGEAQMGTATINNAAIKDLAVTTGKIGDLSVNSLKLANGSVSDVRFYTSNTSTTLASTSTTGTYTIANSVIGELQITTPNPTGLTGPFPTYIHAALATNTRVNGNISIVGLGNGINDGTISISSSLSIIGAPTWQLRIIRSSDNAVIAQSDIVANGAGTKTGNTTVTGIGNGINDGTVNITNIVSVNSGGGLNLLFLSPSLMPNTAYKIQILVSGTLQVGANSASTPVAVTADQRAIYYQILLR